MKILITSLYFYPDHSGIALYSSDFALYAKSMGHEVEVITGYSFYPKWKKRKEDRRKLFSVEEYKGIKIFRGYIYVPQNPTTITRVLQEFTFLLSVSVNFFRVRKPDILVSFTTPISIGFLSSLYKKITRCKLCINIQDFQLEAAGSLGMSKQKLFYSILSKLETYSYKNAELITSISDSMIELLKNKKGIPALKIYLWPNWIEVKEYKLALNNKGNFRLANNISSEKKIIAYAGNIGLKQGLEIFIDLADRFKENSSLIFLIIGEGAGKEMLINYAMEKRIDNIHFLPFLNNEEYLRFLNDVDVFFLSQKKTEFDVYFPSKLLGIMVTGKILLLSADKESELHKTILNNNIGLVADYGDMDKLSELLDFALNDDAVINTIQTNARLYAEKFDKEIVISNALNKINKII